MLTFFNLFRSFVAEGDACFGLDFLTANVVFLELTQCPTLMRFSFDADEKRVTQVEAIWTALTDVGSSSSKRGTGQSFGWTSSEDELELMEQDDNDSETDKSRNFRKLRKAHYDEYLKVKELRQKSSRVEDESEEDDNPELGKGEKKCESCSLSDSVKEMDIEGKKSSTPPANGS
ncbi:hypothetical protein P8452_55434 [Trifolium repens]|nr:hypothetical protein P8452_55434 [Trifolium repens]